MIGDELKNFRAKRAGAGIIAELIVGIGIVAGVILANKFSDHVEQKPAKTEAKETMRKCALMVSA